MTAWTWTTFAAPSRFERLAAKLIPWLWSIAALCGAVGLYVGFWVAPTDFQQGQAYRIIFIHVPAAWMSMVLYLVMAGWAVVGWAFHARLAAMVARALAPTGALFTVLALWTGALWGKPTWGTWWVWDARLTSELILLFLYLGIIALRKDFPANDIKGLIALAKASPGKLNFASVGLGSTQHFAGELFRQMTGIDVKHIPYRGTPAVVTALRAGEVDYAVELVQAVQGQAQSGELKILAVGSPTRWPSSLAASPRPSWMASSRMSFIRIGVPLTADW